MLIRIVKMEFKPEDVPNFIKTFRQNSSAIKAVAGCKHLELLRSTEQTNCFFTYSHWQTNDHLEAYRQSELFKGIWSTTKTYFNAKPQAWSVVSEIVV